MADDRKTSPTEAEADRGQPGIHIDAAVSELSTRIEDAIEFRVSELEPDWELVERYYNGETDLEDFEGRSIAVKTEVRDAIRNSMPSIMRTLLQSRKPVIYIPTNVAHAQWVEQQAEFVTSLFYRNNGYMVLYESILEALKLKTGIIKTFWEPEPDPKYFNYTNVPFTTVEELANDPLVDLIGFEEADTVGDISLYNIEGYKIYENGRIVMESVPNYEFFISGYSNSIQAALDSGVHGHRQIVTVSEAMQLGLECEDWLELDFEDPEESDHGGSSKARRRHVKPQEDSVKTDDVLKHKFLLTEAYAKFDLEGDGRAHVYRFYLGGTSYKLLHYEQVDDSPFALIRPIPIQHTANGHALGELVVEEQDTNSSMLRATIDNAHAANNVRIAADPNRTDFDDIDNPALNASIRKMAGDTLQVIQFPSAAQGNIGLLAYLDQDVQNKVGVTKAAQGLDPDALQSTDKDAVLNTIMTAQGQTELMVRNIVETGLIRVFNTLLRLTVQHASPRQMMVTKGKVLPINVKVFDLDAVAMPNVGIGTANVQQRVQMLSFVLQKQEQYMQAYGPNNPFTSFAQIYNTLEDMLEFSGIYNVERHFNIVTPEVERQWAQMQEKRKAEVAKLQAQNQPMDPSKAFLEVEKGKRSIEQLQEMARMADNDRERALKAEIEAEKLDVARDKMVQDRAIKLREINAEQENARIVAEQKANEKVNLNREQSNGKKPVSSTSSRSRNSASE